MDRITVALLRARRKGITAGGEAVRPYLNGAEQRWPNGAERSPEFSSASEARHAGIEPTSEPTSELKTLLPVTLPVDRSRLPRPARITYTRSRVVKISRQHFAHKRIAVDQTHAELLDAVRVLRTQVLQRMRENGWRTLAVVGASDDDGKSLVAVNLAVSIAMELHHTALLVDANMRNPAVHAYLGLSHKPGLAHHLVHNAPLETLLVNPGINRLLVMPAGAAQPNAAELVGSEQMADLVDELKTRYSDRIVIFDLPPLLKSADALAFIPNVDAVLLVVGDGVTARDDLKRAEALLASSNLIGVTLNFARERGARGTPRRARRPGLLRRLFSIS